MPKITLDEVFETKEEIAHAVKKELEKVGNINLLTNCFTNILSKDMEEYGYDIKQTLITDIIPDINVKKVPACLFLLFQKQNPLLKFTSFQGYEWDQCSWETQSSRSR